MKFQNKGESILTIILYKSEKKSKNKFQDMSESQNLRNFHFQKYLGFIQKILEHS